MIQKIIISIILNHHLREPPVRTSSNNDILKRTPSGHVNVALVTFQEHQSGDLWHKKVDVELLRIFQQWDLKKWRHASKRPGEWREVKYRILVQLYNHIGHRWSIIDFRGIKRGERGISVWLLQGTTCKNSFTTFCSNAIKGLSLVFMLIIVHL